MEISVKISDELAAQAKARGLRVEDYVEYLLAQLIEAASVNSSFRGQKLKFEPD